MPDFHRVLSAAAQLALVGTSPGFRELMRQVCLVAADGDGTVLIVGEEGTSKSALARLIHLLGPRASQRYWERRISSLPTFPTESDLFGNASLRTAAGTTYRGALAFAGDGTLFVDKVLALTLPMQHRLLDVLQDRRFRRVNGLREHRFDARLLCGADPRLIDCVIRGTLLPEFYDSLAGTVIHIPSLRERPDDIPLLVRRTFAAHFPERANLRLAPDAFDYLQRLDYPENDRELMALIDAGVARCRNDEVTATDLQLAR